MKVSLANFARAMLLAQCVALFGLATADGQFGLLLAVAVFGVMVGNVLMLHPLIIAQAFGVKAFPRLYPLSQLVVTVGVATGPALLGVLHDHGGGYVVAFAAAGALALASALVLAVAGPLEGAARASVRRDSEDARP